MDLNKIKPKVEEQSDKYSWNFYKFLKKQFKVKQAQQNIKVYFIARSKWDGTRIDFIKEEPLRYLQVAISPRWGRSSGYFLDNIIQGSRNTEFSLNVYREDELIDITDWFFKEYERRGRCIFHEHGNIGWVLGKESRYTVINNTRRCNWCGHWQQKEIETVKTIERREKWT